MAERPRFFTPQQKWEHAQNNDGWKCEGRLDDGTPCDERVLEAHHMDSYSKGGETEEENLLLLGKVCHAIFHLIADEPWAANLIKKRMTPEELAEYHRRGY